MCERNRTLSLRGPLIAGLKTLDLSDCRLGDSGVGSLVSFAVPPTLRWLRLGENDVSDQGAALVRSPGLEGVKLPWLNGNQLSDESKQLVRDRFGEDCYL
jgi:hypothetical protein